MRVWLLLLAAFFPLAASNLEIRQKPVHLRSGAYREWNEFPAVSLGPSLKLTFQAAVNEQEWTLSLRQRDVKLNTWTVTLNGARLGALQADERDMRTVIAIPARTLQTPTNVLQIQAEKPRFSDDIEVRELRIFRQPVREYLSQAAVSVTTAVEGEANPLPVRISIVDSAGALVPVAPLGNPSREAVRTGVVYTADGRTRIGLPFGSYEIFTSRGWEYNAPSQRISVNSGTAQADVALRLRREVRMPGYVSCDTHVHTLELSGHGDATVRERIITAAGEGLDIIVATEHNQIADYTTALRELGLGDILSVVRGDEVTTKLGHFNVFPFSAGATPPPPNPADWETLRATLLPSGRVRVVVQNHPRDLHLNYRPFDPVHHVSPAGENLIGRTFFANAMEVINSGAMYSDMLQLVRDWLGLLNRGHIVAAVGASDTHTVDFVPIGQARTYIQSDNREAAFEQLARGQNFVSYGLGAVLRPIRSTAAGHVEAEVEVYGPSWSAADRLIVYANGSPVVSRTLNRSSVPGVKHRQRVSLTLHPHDVTLAAVATGPGVIRPFWEVRKPYQPVSKDWHPTVMGVSNAIRIDVDGNGFSPPREYAESIVARNSSVADLTKALRSYDSAVAIQALAILAGQGRGPGEFRDAFRQSGPSLRTAWETFASAWAGSGKRAEQP